jgi:hypothetical protein
MDNRQAALRRAARVWLVAVLLVAYVVLAGCGGGSGSGSNSGPGTVSQAPSPTGLTASQQATAEKLYAGTPRTPADFYADPPPVGATGSVQTLHLKNTDATPGAAGHYELCSDDSAQALAWSESKTAALSSYADLVEQNATPRLFEFVRVPRNDVNARLRHRVFRCSYVDRSATDLVSDSGPAGTVYQRPADAASLKDLAEYLWQFTLFNNADHVVLTSTAASATGANEIAHAIDMARLTRGATASDCDRIDLLRWTHTLNTSTGALRRQLDTVSTFSARRANGVVSSCPP